MVAVTGFERVSDVRTVGKRSQVAWESLVGRLTQFRRAETKDGPGWAPAVFRDEPCTCGGDQCQGAGGHRIKKNVVELHALVFDLDKMPDKRPLTSEAAEAALSRLDDLGLQRIIHTTHSHCPPERASLRVVIALSRPVLATQWESFWRAAQAFIAIHVERSCFDASRFWYAPSCTPLAQPWARAFDGHPLDVDLVLAQYKAESKPARSTTSTYQPRADTFDMLAFMSSVYPGARPENGGGCITRWEIECPWEHEHSSSSPRDTMVSYGGEGPGFSCLHDHCKDRHWRDFRKFHQPGWVPFDERPAYQQRPVRGTTPPAARSDAPTPPDELRARRERSSSPSSTPTPPPSHAGYGPGGGYRLTDVGNARRFADTHRGKLRYVHAWGQWLTWDGTRWHRDEAGTETESAKQVLASMYAEAAARYQTAAQAINAGESVAPNGSDALVKHAALTAKSARLDAMVKLARSEPEFATPRDLFDRDPMVLNVLNGTIDLREGELRPHRQGDMLTMLAPVEYDPSATCPQFEAFLERVIPDSAVREWVQRYFGYALTGNVREQCLAFFVGGGANGKSVLLDVVLDLMGDYAWRAPADLVLAKYGESHPTEVAALESRRLVACSEIDQGRSWHESRIKQLTGDGKISARKMRQDFYEFEQTAKFVIAANTRPTVKGTDNGIWRRMRYVPWTVKIPEAEQDRDLPRRLVAEEGTGILAWMIRGTLAWQRSGLGSAPAIDAGTAAYRAEQDVIGNWIRDCCELDGWQATATLYESWCEWSKAEGLERPWAKKVWKARLAEQWGVEEARRDNGRVRAMVGLRIKTAIEGYNQ